MPSQDTGQKALMVMTKGAGIAFFGAMVDRGLGYVTRIVLARSLTPAEYGLLFLGFSVIGLIGVFSTLKLEAAARRYIAFFRGKQDMGSAGSALRSSMKLSAVPSLAVFIAVFMFAEDIAVSIFHEPGLAPVLMLMSFILLVKPFLRIFIGAAEGMGNVRYEVYVRRVGKTVITLVAAWAALWMGFGLMGAAWAYLIGFVMALVITIVLFRKEYSGLMRKVTGIGSMNRKLLMFSTPLLATGLLSEFIAELGTLLLGFFTTSVDVGIFNIAVPSAQLLFIIPNSLTVLFMPICTRLLAQRKTGAIKHANRVMFKWIFFLNFPIFLILFFYPDVIVNTIFGSDYLGAGTVLRITSIGFFLYSMGVLAQSLTTVYAKTKYNLYNLIISLAVMLGVSVLLIPSPGPWGGVVGAAVALTAMRVVLTALYYYQSHYLMGISPVNPKIYKAVISGFLSVIAVWAVTSSFPEPGILTVLLSLACFALVYAASLLLQGGLEKEDLEVIRTIEKRVGIRLGPVRGIVKRFIR